MVSPNVLPGRAFAQNIPNSNLLLHWRAQDRTLITVDRLSTGTLTRASAGGLTDGRGQRTANALTDVRLVGPAADNQPRWGVSTAGVPHLLLEDTRTNLFPFAKPSSSWQLSDALSTGGETTVAPDGTLVTLLIDASTVAIEFMTQDVEIASTVAVMTWYTKWNGSTFGAVHQLKIRDASGAADRGQVIWNFGSTGTMNITSTGAGTVLSGPAHKGNNWWKTSLECTSISTGNDNQIEITPQIASGPAVGGDMFISEIQVEDVPSTGRFASSHIPTVSAAVTRAKEALTFPFLPVPQEMTALFTFIERGTGQGTDFALVWRVGTGNQKVEIRKGSGSNGYEGLITTSTGATSITGELAAPTIGQSGELRLVVSAAGALTLGLTIAGGAELLSTAAATSSELPGAWASQVLLVADNGFVELESLKFSAGTKDRAQMREAF